METARREETHKGLDSSSACAPLSGAWLTATPAGFKCIYLFFSPAVGY